MNKSGFTLMEVLVYLALFGVLLGGAGTAAYTMLEAGGRLQSKAYLQDEGNFLLDKFDWAMAGASSVAVSAAPPRLVINKYNDADNPLVFDLSGTEIRLQQGAGAPQNLNGSAAVATNFSLQDLPPQGNRPEGVSVNFMLQMTPNSGSVLTQDFSSTKYLWK